jgi:hypothetical protein
MKKKTIGFKGEEFESISIEDFKDKWVLIKSDGECHSGFLSHINKNEIGLLPYQDFEYLCDGRYKYYVEAKGLPHMIEKGTMTKFKETSLENVMNFCEHMNQEEYKSYLLKRKELFELTKINENINKESNKIIPLK